MGRKNPVSPPREETTMQVSEVFTSGVTRTDRDDHRGDHDHDRDDRRRHHHGHWDWDRWHRRYWCWDD
jgi:hypothetical protein